MIPSRALPCLAACHLLACGGGVAPTTSAAPVRLIAATPDGGDAAAAEPSAGSTRATSPQPAGAGGADGADGGDGADGADGAWSYAPGRRDPFRRFLDDERVPDVPIAPGCGGACAWDLDQLRLVGTVSGVLAPLAVLEDPEGRGHVVRRGSWVGRRAGQVVEVRRGELVVRQAVRRESGSPTWDHVVLRPRRTAPERPDPDLLTR